MKARYFLTAFIFLCTCQEEQNCCVPEVACKLYRYDAATGKCKNCKGKEGLNALDIDYIESNKDAECFDLTDLELILLHKKISEAGSLRYDILEGYNFKGAKLDSAELFFNFIYRADFRGTDLSTLQYGYAIIKGAIDEHTKLPLNGDCEHVMDSIHCSR
jgi:hypothetical protein